MRIINFLVVILLFTINANAVSFSQSKKILLKKVYFDNQYTFYCGNPYEYHQ